MWAITDFTEENGATRLDPGQPSARRAPNPLEPYETIAAEMPKGSVLVWVGSLWHGGGANRTDTRRVGIAMNYCAGYIRQQENQQLGIPPQLVKQFPRRLQELVGLLRLQRPDRAHRQAASGQVRPDRERRRRDGLGSPQGLSRQARRPTYLSAATGHM